MAKPKPKSKTKKAGPITASNSGQIKAKSPVEYERPEYGGMLPTWRLIRAALEGEKAIKLLGQLVLPMPNADDQSPENKARYDAYLGRAVWYNVSARTLEGMVGYVFKKEPTITLPGVIAALEENADGAGVSLQQQAKDALRLALGLGRGGLLVDYPQTQEMTTRAQQLAGNVQPTINLIAPEQITNWRTTVIGAKKVLTMIVIKEATWAIGADEFELVEVIQYRVLDIITEETPQPEENGTSGDQGLPPLQVVGSVRGRVFEAMGDGRDYIENHSKTYYPTDSKGQPLTEIPFQFIGWVQNAPEIDKPPLEDLVNLNIAHFRNSADYEETSFITGQPTPYVAGISEQWAKEVLGGSVRLGSRGLIPLPAGGTCGLIQASANTVPKEAMDHKEQQMVALGAKLVQQQKMQRTATEASMDNTAETSVLTSAATNVFLAYEAALRFACIFAGADDATLDFELSEPLTRETLDPNAITAMVNAWMNTLLSYTEIRTVFKQSGLAFEDDDKVREEGQNQLPPANAPTPGLPPKPAPAPKPAPQPAPAK